jgi:tetratricopeptide (TPR) repeat protein
MWVAVPRALAAEPDRIGGRYIVEAKLGAGGMGAVYRVRDEAGKRLALKRMAWSGDDRESARRRFRREFHTMASLRHPRIVEVYDYGIDGDAPYYTLELLDGQDLHDLDRVPWQRACELMRDVASALAFLHARRLLHRDLAPRNVRCTSDGRAKLIDFGVLATTGITGDIAGTPPFMAPETVHGRPLDHRYDLYGLGALLYRILTGRHAYPARTIEQLEIAWRHRPPAPSAIASDVPSALDELVFALLAHDPLARPAGAAEVIDRLSAIAGLERPADVETTHGWIASAALVGRQREMQQIRRAVARVNEGAGRSVLIEAPSGTGKSRLLRELALEAQLAGTCVVRTESDAAGRGPYGIFHELARGLLATAPAEAEAAARSRGEQLARVVPELRERLGVKPAKPRGEPSDDRMRLQEDIAAWVLEIAGTRAIALLVDDVQRCDEASAAVLAALAHQAAGCKLLVGVALRTDETVRAPSAIASLVDAGQRLRLRGLDESDVGELCRSLFGDVSHIPRLAQWMHHAAGGSPLHTTELARHLVDRGVIRYIDGLWSIPEDPGREDLPRGLAEAMDSRVRSLPADARALGEALSVHGGDLPLDLIVALADTKDEGQVFAALDALAFEEVLIQSGPSWRFRHDGLREAMLRNLDDARKRALHLRVGETLAAAGEITAERDAEIGWHLLRGGDVAGGARRLERAGRALFTAQSFCDCIAPLEAALEVLGKRPRVRCELLHMLLVAGCMADRKAAIRHAPACVEGYRYWSGVDVAARAGKLVGRHVGIFVGLFWACMRWVFSIRRGPNPYEALRTFFIVVGFTASIYSLMFDLPKIQKLIDLVDPIAMFKKRVPYAVYLLTCNTLEYPRGNSGAVVRNCRQLLHILDTDHITPISDIDRRTGGGGARYMLVLVAVSNLDPSWRDELAELVKIKLKFYDVGAENAMIIYHRLRGEEELAAEIEAKVELMFVQLGSVWQMEAFMPLIASLAYAFARDNLGLRRVIDKLARQVADGFKYEPYLQLARGEYLRERGDAEASRIELEPLLDRTDMPMILLPALPALAETLLALGQLERAKELAERGVALGRDRDYGNFHAEMRSLRALGLVEAALGQHAEAASHVDEAVARSAERDSPLLSGALHEARARIALSAGDAIAYHEHLAETEHHFRRTRNPALIARAERLSEAGTRHAATWAAQDEPVTQASGPKGKREAEVSIVAAEAVTTPPPKQIRDWVSAVLSGCRGSGERATRALQLVVEEAHAASGYLYLRHHGQLVLAAPTWGEEPPHDLVRALAQAVAAPDEPPTVADIRRGGEKLDWKPVPLVLKLGDKPYAIGGIAVVAGGMPLVEPSAELLAEIARELYEAGDVTHTRTMT